MYRLIPKLHFITRTATLARALPPQLQLCTSKAMRFTFINLLDKQAPMPNTVDLPRLLLYPGAPPIPTKQSLSKAGLVEVWFPTPTHQILFATLHSGGTRPCGAWLAGGPSNDLL